MSSVLKHRGLLPTEESVAIPDIVFSKAPKPEAPLSGDEIPADSPPEQEEITGTVPDEIPTPPEPAVPTFTPQDLESYYHTELEELRKKAEEQGFSAAYNDKRAALETTITKVDRTLAEMQQLQDDYISRAAEALKYTAIEIAEKMIGQKIKMDDTIIKPMVMQAVAEAKTNGWMNVEISQRLVNLVNEMREELSAAKFQGKAEVTPLDCPDTTCRVVTIEGTVDASISTQAENLRRVFRGMDNK